MKRVNIEANSMSKSFNDHFRYFEEHWSETPQWNDIKSLLEWVEDNPSKETDLGELSAILGRSVTEVVPILAILTAGPEPIGNIFFKIRSIDGNLYAAENVSQNVREGKEPFKIPQTGEVINDFAANAYVFVRFETFGPDLTSPI